MKLQGIMDWPTPQTLTHIKAFLGFTNFYREFIPRYSDLVEPLNRLSRKDVVMCTLCSAVAQLHKTSGQVQGR